MTRYTVLTPRHPSVWRLRCACRTPTRVVMKGTALFVGRCA